MSDTPEQPAAEPTKTSPPPGAPRPKAAPKQPPAQPARVLNQAEIDSLLGFDEGPGGGENRTGMQQIISSGLVSYERLPMLEIVFDRLVRIMSTSLRNFTSDNVEVGIDNILSLRFGDYLNSIPLPAMLAVFKAEEWDNYGLMVVDSAMIYSIVDVLLGGRRGTAAMRIEGRPYTTIERTLVERLIQVVLADLSASFDPLCPVTFRFERLEVNPRFATINRLSNAAVLARLRIDMEDRGGRLELLLPYATLEPVRELLLQQFMGEKFGRDSIWETHLAEELWNTEVELDVVLDEQIMRLSDVMDADSRAARIVLNTGAWRAGVAPLRHRAAVRGPRRPPQEPRRRAHRARHRPRPAECTMRHLRRYRPLHRFAGDRAARRRGPIAGHAAARRTPTALPARARRPSPIKQGSRHVGRLLTKGAPQWPAWNGSSKPCWSCCSPRRCSTPAAGTRARRAEARSRRAGGAGRRLQRQHPPGGSRHRAIARRRGRRRATDGAPDRHGDPPEGRPGLPADERGDAWRTGSIRWSAPAARSPPSRCGRSRRSTTTDSRRTAGAQPGGARPAQGTEDGAMKLHLPALGCCRSPSPRWPCCWR